MKHTLACILLFILVVRGIDFKSAKINFSLPCNKPMCQDYEVAKFIDQIKEVTNTNEVYLSHVWGTEVTLLICKHPSISSILNFVESAEGPYSGISVGNVKWDAPCMLYAEAGNSYEDYKEENNGLFSSVLGLF